MYQYKLLCSLCTIAFLIMTLAPVSAAEGDSATLLVDMMPMSELEMGGISGQEGIMLDLRLRNNVDENNNPIGCTGTLNSCRMGLEFAAREGRWLMLKDYYGTLEAQDIRLDATFLRSAASGFQDYSRFMGPDGSCLIQKGTNNCTSTGPNGMAAIQISYPLAKGAGEYEDLHTFLNIGRVAVEFDQGATPGYMRDVNTGSVLGYRISDSGAANASMQMRFDGKAYVYGY